MKTVWQKIHTVDFDFLLLLATLARTKLAIHIEAIVYVAPEHFVSGLVSKFSKRLTISTAEKP